MIPKIIHYCWLGPNKKTDLILKCIDSWHRQMPEFEIKEWNESNFDLSHHKFMAQAYDSGKYAFASDPLFVIVCSSDSIEWCKHNEKKLSLDFNKDNVIFVDGHGGKESYRDMQIISLCKHAIITNSSFGWWGSFLIENKDKITISPMREYPINTTIHL